MNKQWEAQWITDAAFIGLQPIDLFHKEMEPKELPDHREDLKNLHMLARTTWVLDDDFTDAALELTADDYYKVYINGQFVGQGPAQGNYFHYYYNRFDITPYLQKGNNVIAVHVYYQGLICRSYNSGDYRQGLIAEVSVDGRLVAKTDETWMVTRNKAYASGGIIGYNTQYLEHIDNRLQPVGWQELAYQETDWTPASVHADDDHQLQLQPTPPLAVYTVKPAKVKPLAEGGYILDFGGELTGQFKMRAHGRQGQIIELRCGEELFDNERVRYEMRCNCTYQELWTLSGDHDELDQYDYKAFRYVEVLADSSIHIDIDSFAAVVRHYPLDEEACQFESSDSMLNAIWTICTNGLKFGSQENYVDCPSREKGQYLGDNTIITHAHAYVSGDLRLFRKSLVDFALLSSHVCPGIMAVAPGHFMQEIADFSFQWPIQLLEYYKQSGDEAFLREMYPVAEEMLRHFNSFQREDGLLTHVADKWNLVDWPEGMRDDYDFPLTRPVSEGCHNVVNAFYYSARVAVAQIRKILQIEEHDDLESFKQAFRQVFWSEQTKLFVDAEGSKHSSLHANALPLLFGLVGTKDREAVVELLQSKRLSCGVYMAYFLLKALAAAGEYALVYDLIRSEDLHSWGNMVKEGATTCFEAWSKDLKWNTSLCHPWASAPIPLLIEEIIGLKPAAPGWTEVSFHPHMPETLEWLKISFEVPSGTIHFEHKHGQSKLSLPEGVSIRRD
ncbi:Alpha-L-rhamnosidase N-terminal domain-containing protein [Paenibacillus sp. 1_12]|uniref:family 78 glycoside hydrolase catalytic domain n=1 Tax=Paenibacillus sp. 1_12 TaxID=1566278 RepID=UPI0008E19EB0|nr:family 78 glycoside hydrolase catalytic domain [Paenibacillus sp. 1_12]SFL26572.1 Alpha-L-rhamnosidase N-terminal domain-containing protein [Paenibacillus sp. 1_12]